MQQVPFQANMRSVNKTTTTMNSPAIYLIRVQGTVPLDWSSRLMGMNITPVSDDQGEKSTLVGRLPDQSALCGVLNTLYEKQFPVLMVECVDVG
jgi:hypothetical protein